MNAEALTKELARARAESPPPNPLLALAAEGRVTVDHLRRLVAVERAYHHAELVAYGELLTRFPHPPVAGFLIEVAGLVDEARAALAVVAERLGKPPDLGDDLAAHAFCGYVSWLALHGSQAATALSLYSAPDGVYYGGAVELVRLLDEHGVTVPGEFTAYYGNGPAPLLTEAASAVVDDGLARGDDPGEALRAARLCDRYMALLWTAAART
ncbi:hypothetical protein [Streptosporangium saharense]|uniref:hypothetical protein n=1 Tax=Streptosporangium saharense TaxID=1706840 RepID=UPI0034427A71